MDNLELIIKDILDKAIIHNSVDNIKTQSRKKILLFQKCHYLIINIIDCLCFISILKFCPKLVKKKKIVYTQSAFCSFIDGKWHDRVTTPLFNEDIIYLNYSREKRIKKIGHNKVYNIGGIVSLLLFLKQHETKQIRLFYAYSRLNDFIIKLVPFDKCLYIPCYYDLNGLSLIFSKYRSEVKIAEIQHGSMINFGPYNFVSQYKLADIMFVRNESTIRFLNNRVNINFSVVYELIPIPKVRFSFNKNITLIYASTIEIGCIHPVLINFLRDNQFQDFNLLIRLHPRERHKLHIFEDQLNKINIKFKFDESINWLNNEIGHNTILISPWSSIIEEAIDIGISSIIIDPKGEERYRELIDNKICYYTSNLNSTLSELLG